MRTQYNREKPISIIKLIRHDLTRGILAQKVKLCLFAVVFMILCVTFENLVRVAFSSDYSRNLPTITDVFVYIFKGVKVYIPSDEEPFSIPVLWLGVQLLLAFFIMGYASNDREGYGQHLLIRSKSRIQWWHAKFIWQICAVLSYYLLALLVIVVFVGFRGSLSFDFTLSINTQLYELYPKHQMGGTDILLLFLIPVLFSISIGACQMVLEFWVGPVLSFFAIIGIDLASVYFFTPILVGNNAMVQRSELFWRKGIPFSTMILINLIVLLLTYLVGIYKVNKGDILVK